MCTYRRSGRAGFAGNEIYHLNKYEGKNLMLNSALIAQAKWAFSARCIPQMAAVGLNADVASASAGQLILGRVISVGQHGRVQLVKLRIR
jgi:hypothetical protein